MATQIKPLIFGLALLILTCLLPASADGCTCGEIKPCEAYAGADTVFIGAALSVNVGAVTDGVPANAISTTLMNGGSVTRFRVEENFRGAETKEIDVSGSGTTCDYAFKIGDRYLVFARRNPGERYLNTSICSGTSPVNQANVLLRYLRTEQKMATGATFRGEVSRFFFNIDKYSWDLEPLPNVEFVFESGQSRFQTASNKRGRFELKGLPGGLYKIRPDPRVNYSSIDIMATDSQSEWERVIPDHGCVSEWFQAKPSGEISGQIIGTPSDVMWVEILFADRQNRNAIGITSAKVDKDGKFHFSWLPPGKYHIGINLDKGPSRDYPYPEYYYSNVNEKQNATVISLGANEKLHGIELLLPSPLPERTIEGTAVWPDGRAAVNVPIELHNPRTGYRDGNAVWTDSQGRFAITGIEGQTYEISALIPMGTPLVNSKPVKIKLEEKNKPVRLVIELP